MCQIRWHAPRPSTRETFNDLCYFYAKRSPLTACLGVAGCGGPLVLRSWSAEAPAKAGRCKTTRDDRDHRHALCSLSHGLPAYRRGAAPAVSLDLWQRKRAENADAATGDL